MDSVLINKEYYNERYAALDVAGIAAKVQNATDFVSRATREHTSWHGLYYGGLQHRLGNIHILELGAGDGLNALLMAALGAKRVVAVEISEIAGQFIEAVVRETNLSDRVEVAIGDFAAMSFDPRSFDLVVGKAFLHHLTHDIEDVYLEKCTALLKLEGEARFFEPAVNSRILDHIRWLIPVPGRPSRLNRAAFREWQAASPEPPRDNSSRHYMSVGAKYFRTIQITPVGGLERFHRFLPSGKVNQSFRRVAFKVEERIPATLHLKAARSQLVVYRQPINR